MNPELLPPRNGWKVHFVSTYSRISVIEKSND